MEVLVLADDARAGVAQRAFVHGQKQVAWLAFA